MTDNNKNKKTRARKKRLAYIFALFTAALFLAAILIISCVMAALLYAPMLKLPSKYTVCMSREGQSEAKAVKYEAAEESVFKNGRLYVNFTKIADVCRFPVGGDSASLKYKVNGREGKKTEYLVFYTENTRAEVNGNGVAMSAKPFIKNGELFIPADFVTDYVNGVTVTLVDKKINIIFSGEYSLGLQENTENETVDISAVGK